jgi:hypothetical protein
LAEEYIPYFLKHASLELGVNIFGLSQLAAHAVRARQLLAQSIVLLLNGYGVGAAAMLRNLLATPTNVSG